MHYFPTQSALTPHLHGVRGGGGTAAGGEKGQAGNAKKEEERKRNKRVAVRNLPLLMVPAGQVNIHSKKVFST